MSRPITLWTAATLGFLQGGYMVFDGSRKLITGRYFGSQVGPWAHAVAAVGIDYQAMAVPFLVLGSTWVLGSALLLARIRIARVLLLVLSVISLAYLVFGTLISLAVMVCLLSRSARAALQIQT